MQADMCGCRWECAHLMLVGGVWRGGRACVTVGWSRWSWVCLQGTVALWSTWASEPGRWRRRLLHRTPLRAMRKSRSWARKQVHSHHGEPTESYMRKAV